MTSARDLARSRSGAAVALLLLAPAPTIGVAAALGAGPDPLGQAVYLVAKAWIVIFPASWFLLVEKERASLSPARWEGLAIGAAVGLVSAVAIVGAWLLLGGRVDPAAVSAAVDRMGLRSIGAYVVAALGWSFVNSLVEEYVYRWFVYRCLLRLVAPGAAVVGSAAVFTAHHVVALSFYLEPVLVAVASAGVFVGGAVWSLLYRRYGSIWPGWVAHVLADLAIFGIGGWIVFGGG